MLTMASFIFYGYWNPPYVGLITASILFNFFCGRTLATHQCNPARRGLLIACVGVNLSVLGYFKYFNFFLENSAILLGHSWTPWEIFLPLGISFFTFQQIAYLVDTCRTRKAEPLLLDYMFFVTFFPQLIAGPIVHHEDLLPQLRRPETYLIHWRSIATGLTLLALGLFKKVILADTLSPWVEATFDSSLSLSAMEAWFGALAYTFQIYFDFSGYSDMALGLGSLFRIELPENFASPYQAISIADFWHRWHMTLSRFLRDYLYIPLGGNRRGPIRRYANLLLTMLLGGLWHGAAWTFVLWGMLHGIYLCVNHAWSTLRSRWELPPLPQRVGWGLTFGAVVVAWVFFRALSLTRAWEICQSLMGLSGIGSLSAGVLRGTIPDGLFEPFVLGGALAFCLWMPRSTVWCTKAFGAPSWCTGIGVAGAALCALLSLTRVSEFLYFQF